MKTDAIPEATRADTLRAEEALDRRYELLYQAEYSTRYHRRRAAFLGNLDTLLTLVTVAAGASTFGQLVAGTPGWLAKIGAAAVTLISLAKVILRLGPSASAHTHWLKRWTALHTALVLKSSPDEGDVGKWLTEKAAIETECVGEFRALCYDCENAAARVMGLPDRQRFIDPLQRLLFHFGTFQRHFPLEADPQPPVPKARAAE